MNGRQRSNRAKRIGKEVLGYTPGVRLGEGTARSWITLYIESDGPTTAQYNELIARFRAEGLCGVYYPDDGTGDERTCLKLVIGYAAGFLDR